MRVRRTQYPVGQGCFHAGHIRWNEDSHKDDEFRYVYDCGSTKQRALREAINIFRWEASRIDALFVSHLHSDHVSGLDRLLGMVKADTVYIPHVDDLTRVVHLIEADMDGTLTASLIEASIDPGAWFGRRGVARVVQVQASPGDGPLAPGIDDVDGGGPDDLPRADSAIYSKTGPRFAGRFGVRSEVLKMNSGNMVPAAKQAGGINWVLVPHVDPAPAVQLEDFRSKLRAALGLMSRQRITFDRLAIALRDPAKRKQLRYCYEKTFPGDHNRVSMSLYSGPTGHRKRPRWQYMVLTQPKGWPAWLPGAAPIPFWPCERDAVAWVGTGDAMLCDCRVRAAWQRSYQAFREEISTLLLPHHGAAGSFHRDLLGFPHLELCVASAGDPSRYNHPGLSVVQAINDQHKTLHHVSQRPGTVLHEDIVSI